MYQSGKGYNTISKAPFTPPAMVSLYVARLYCEVLVGVPTAVLSL